MKTPLNQKRTHLLVLLVAIATFVRASSLGVDYTWTGASNSFWGEPLNWAPNGVPNEITNDFVLLPESGFTNIIIADADGLPATYAVTNLQVNCTNEATANLITIPGGSKFTASFLQLGPTNLTEYAATIMRVEGTGEFWAGPEFNRSGVGIQIGKSLSGPGNAATLDLSGLSTFITTNIGQFTVGDRRGTNAGLVILATNNFLSEGEIDLGFDPPVQEVMLLGPGTNLLGGTMRICVGSGGQGILKFATTNGSVAIRPRSGLPVAVTSAADFQMQAANTASPMDVTNLVDFRGHYADIIARDVLIATRNDLNAAGNGRAGIINNQFYFDQGTFNCRGMAIGRSGTNAANVNLLSIGGGALTVESILPNTFIPVSIYLGGLGNATLHIGGGTVTTVFGGIAKNPFGAFNQNLGVSTLILDSTNALDPAVLDLNAHPIGYDPTNAIDIVLLQAGTLKNITDLNSGADVVKTGSGVLTLAGTNTYPGGTVVNGGTLVVESDDALGPNTAGIDAASGTLDISALASATYVAASDKYVRGAGTILGSVDAQVGSLVSPGSPYGAGIGNLTVTNAVTLAGHTLLEIDRSIAITNDSITANSITLGGTLLVTNVGPTLVAGTTFTLFKGNRTDSFTSVELATTDATGATYTWANSISAEGTIQLLTVDGGTVVDTNPTNLVVTVSGDAVNLSWPDSHKGWTLQVQTNSAGSGLGTNWVAVPDSSSTNFVTFPVDQANASVFYRLVYP